MVLTFLIAIASFISGQGEDIRVVEDLQQRWKILTKDGFTNYQDSAPTEIYFSVKLQNNDNSSLKIQSKQDFYLFINSNLVAHTNHLMLSLDSLKQKYQTAFFCIYQSRGISDLTTVRVIQEQTSPYYNPLRPDNSFQNFISVAVLLLVIFFTALLRSNPQLTMDYLNVVKLFSLKHRDDSQFVLRVTSSVNLLFYFFCSMLTSLGLLVALHFSDNYEPFITSANASATYFLRWFLISVLICCILLFKLGYASILSYLFGWKDTGSFQFFNFVRVLVISLLLIGLVGILSFSLGLNLNYIFLIKFFCGILSLGAVLLFFKLLNRESTTPFHLFSYLCASEILPLVILIKVFLF